MTGLDLITSSLRLIGAIAVGENTPSDEDVQVCLPILNEVIEDLNLQRNTIYQIDRQVYPLTPTQQDYTFGPGGNFNAARPIRIETASVLQTPSGTQPLELPIKLWTYREWQTDVPIKNVVSSLPQGVYNNNANPLALLSFFPIPTIPISFVAYVWKALTAVTDITADIVLAPGYSRMLRYALAVEICPVFEKPLTDAIARGAADSLGKVKSLNSPKLYMKLGSELKGGKPFNYITGE